MKISLIGYMGSGKSSVGRELSNAFDVEFLDLDELIQGYTHKDISTLFKEEGELKFRKIERALLLDTLNKDSDYVLALGGGTPVYYNNMEEINRYTTSVYLRSAPAHLAQRLLNEKAKRPLIAHLSEGEMTEFVAKHLFERRNFYDMAFHTIDVNSKTVKEICEEIILLLNSHQK